MTSITGLHPTAAFHHAQLEQGVIRILLAAPTFPSPSTTITVPAAAGAQPTSSSSAAATGANASASAGATTAATSGGHGPNGIATPSAAAAAGGSAASFASSFSRASSSAVHLLTEVFRRILGKYAMDAQHSAEREQRAVTGFGDVIRALEGVGGEEVLEELMEWCLARGREEGEVVAAEEARIQRPRLQGAPETHEDGDTEYHFRPLPRSLYATRELLDERDREAQEAARLLRTPRPLLSPSDSGDEDSSDEEEDWSLALLREAEREMEAETRLQENGSARGQIEDSKTPLALPAPPKAETPIHAKLEAEAEPTSARMAVDGPLKAMPNGHAEADDAMHMDVDALESGQAPGSPDDVVMPDATATPDPQLPSIPPVPQLPRSRTPRHRVPRIPVDPSLSAGANSFLTPAATITGSSTDPALLHMGKQRRTIALVLSDPQRFGPSPSLYGAAPPARSGAEPGSLPFVPGPSLLITLPRPGAQSAAPFFTPVHPYGRTAGGAGAPPGGSMGSTYRHNSDLFLAARTVCDPALLRRATRTEDPAPLLDESFAERVFQGWSAERDLLEQAALGRGALAPAVRALKRQKEIKRAEEGGGKGRKKKKRKVGPGVSASSKGKGKAVSSGSGAAGGKKARGGANRATANRPGGAKGKSRSIYVDDYDEDEFDDYLDGSGGRGNDDDDEGGCGPRSGSGRASRIEDDEDSEDEELKAPESGMLVHTWDWQTRDYADAQLPLVRMRGRLRSGGPPGTPASASAVASTSAVPMVSSTAALGSTSASAPPAPAAGSVDPIDSIATPASAPEPSPAANHLMREREEAGHRTCAAPQVR
ncbi:hypothetical protein V8E36_006151 [Tilletia maclaganii]